jgi:hypothetical protein
MGRILPELFMEAAPEPRVRVSYGVERRRELEKPKKPKKKRKK